MRIPTLALLLAPLLASAQDCPPPEAPRERLRALAAQQWKIDDDALRSRLALSLMNCLAAPDAELRDDLALGALTAWMRGGALTVELARLIGERALALMAAPDEAGFGPPFAALALAEVARADRLKPLWTPGERDTVVQAAARFLAGVRDYRGFDPREGWRHGVAHGADLLMQLALNPLLDRAQLDRILDAVLSQATPGGHFYVFGEGERLTRPVVFVARRGLHTEAEWTAWLGRVALAGAPERGVPMRLDALARQHNAKALLLPLYASLQEGGDAALRARLLPGLAAALRTLW
jgi:hypothetical protein